MITRLRDRFLTLTIILDGYDEAAMSNRPLCYSISLCDLVITEAGSNKNSLIGTFGNIFSSQAPFTYGPFWTSSVIGALPKGKALQVLTRVVDPSTKEVLGKIEASINIPAEVPDDVTVDFNALLPPMTFPYFGKYFVEIQVDGDTVGLRPLTVLEKPQP